MIMSKYIYIDVNVIYLIAYNFIFVILFYNYTSVIVNCNVVQNESEISAHISSFDEVNRRTTGLESSQLNDESSLSFVLQL